MRIFPAYLGLLTALLPGIATATWETGWIGNWLVGLSAGYGDREGQINLVTTYTSDQAIPESHIVRNLNDTGFVWGGFVGYQAICHQWLTGIELNVDRQAISEVHNFAFSDPMGIVGWHGSARYQRKVVGGLSGRLGYALRTNFMPYLRAGVELADDRFKTFYYSPVVLEGLPAFNEQSQWVYRFLLGIGVEFPIIPTCGTTLRLEYDYHSKGKTLQTNAALYDGLFTPLFTSQSQPQTQTGKISLVWNFF